MTPASIELILGAVRLASVVIKQINLSNLDELPENVRAELLFHRDALLGEMRRLDTLGEGL